MVFGDIVTKKCNHPSASMFSNIVQHEHWRSWYGEYVFIAEPRETPEMCNGMDGQEGLRQAACGLITMMHNMTDDNS